MVTSWVVAGLALWFGLAFVVAVVVGRSIRLADRRSGRDAVLTTAALDVPSRSVAPAGRRSIPVPPVGIALIVLAMVLEAVGFFARLSGVPGPAGELLSMDAPFSLPRMYVSALFAISAALAVAASARIPGRRGWWLAVGVVGGAIAAVKAGGTVHATAMARLQAAVGAPAALALSVLVAGVVLASLLFLSRAERRDRRRIVGVLLLYAGASVGLSAVSGAMPSPALTAAATFVEESGEALAGVGFLLAVLAGVAPRLVLPAAWGLRRTADAHTLDAAEPQPGWSSAPGTVR